MKKLRIVDEEGNETLFTLEDEMTIGRADDNTIRLEERNVSRHHARIFREGDRYFLEPVAARYGIKRVEGGKIEGAEALMPGRGFLVGDFQLSMKAPMARPSPPPELHSSPGAFSDEPTLITGSPSPAPVGFGPPRAEGTAIIPAQPARLVIVSSNFAGQEFPLARQQMVIGRSEDCDIIIDHRSVSSHHAKITRDANGAYQIIDLDSKNGMRIGPERYTNVYLKRGDIVELGHVKFRFVEPGENYIFTPGSVTGAQSAVPAIRPPSGRSNTTIYAAIGAVALAAVVSIGLWASNNSSTTTPPAAKPNNTIAAKTTPKTTTAAPATPKTSPQVTKGLQKAKEELDRGNIEGAISVLDLLKMGNPSGPDLEKIGDMLSKARQERPFKDSYTAAKTNVQDKDFVGALRHIRKIPSHSIFAKRLEKDGIRKSALDGAFNDAATTRKKSEALSIIEEILLVDREYSEAIALQQKLTRRPVAVAVRNTTPNPGTTRVRRPRATAKPRPKPRTAPVKRLTRDEANALFKAAQREIVFGSPQTAVDNCKQLLPMGYKDCHRILGLAYRKQKKKGRACISFQRYLNTRPPNAEGVKNMMTSMGCQ